MENIKKSGLEEEYLKLVDDVDDLELISGAGWKDAVKSITSCSIASFVLGNDGYVCTWTAECVSGCNK